MTTAEFSSEFDVIYENINKGGAPGLDTYEKSVILSHAQELLVKEILVNEPSADRFPALISVLSSTSPTTNGFEGGYVFDMPVGYLKILNEVVVNASSTAVVLAISNEQFQEKRSKAYKYPPRRRAWRLPLEETGKESVEIFVRPEFTSPVTYKCRYVKKPVPIILGTISPAIDGITTVTECELDTGLHRDILRIATSLAEQYYMDKYGTDGNK